MADDDKKTVNTDEDEGFDLEAAQIGRAHV